MYAKLWHKEIPFKISFNAWRVLKRKLPFDDTIHKVGININTDCICCRTPKHDTLNHFFSMSDLAAHIWNFFSNPLGFNIRGRNPMSIINQWWNIHAKNQAHQLLLYITPVIILWELWKARCGKKYGNNNISRYKIQQQVLMQVKTSLGHKFGSMEESWNWNTVCQVAEKYKPQLKSTMVMWEKPKGNEWKLNTDGSFNSEEGKAGAGGIVRKRNGHMVMAFATPVHFYTNNYSEVKAALHGVQWCITRNPRKLILELDSLLVVNMILGKCKIPWKLQRDITTIQQMVQQNNIQIQHCFREGNEVADLLSKHAHNLNNMAIFLEESELPREVRGAIRIDRIQLPTFRIRPKNHSGWHFEPP